MKFVGGLLAPVFLMAHLKDLEGWDKRASFIAKVCVASIALAVVLYAPLWIGPDMLGIERRKGMFTVSIPTIAMLTLTPRLGDNEARQTVAEASAILFGLFLIWKMIKLNSDRTKLWEVCFDLLYVYLLFFCLWFQAWYLTWILALAAIVPKLDTANKAMLFSYTAIWSYFVFSFVGVRAAEQFDLLTIQGCAVAAVYTLPLLLTGWSWLGFRVTSRLRARTYTG
jgi:hypothetical protein